MLDPNWISAGGQVAAALVTVVAVIVALQQGKKATTIANQARYDAVRPVLMIQSTPGPMGATSIATQPNHPIWLEWNESAMLLDVQNVGSGTAFNVVSVLYGPEAVTMADGQKRDSATRLTHWTFWDSMVFRPGDKKTLTYKLGGSAFSSENMTIHGSSKKKSDESYSFNAPAQPLFTLNPQEATYICRVVTTYHDTFGRKHTSIFNCDESYRWHMVACLENIKHDLLELEGNKVIKN